MCLFPLFIICMAYFSMPNSISMLWLYILTACIRVSNYFSLFKKILMTSMYIMWLISSYDLLNVYLQCIFWIFGCVTLLQLQIVMVIVYLPRIYLSGSLLQLSFFSCSQFHSPRSNGFLDKMYDFIWYLEYFAAIYYPA